jgi:penicillin amidase
MHPFFDSKMRITITIVALSLLAACPANHSDPSRDVRIVRDHYGVPHVYADTIYGLYYGYGYAIAQDRLFQMEMSRRSTQGHVAEVLGPDYVEYDMNARTLFSPASIKSQLAALSQDDMDVFEGYAAGINAWLNEVRQSPDTLMPMQFIDLEFVPADWSAYDIAMIFIGTMNNRYGDYNTELENAAILAALIEKHGEQDGRALFDVLNPRFTDNAPTSIPRQDWSRTAYDSLAKLSMPRLDLDHERLALTESPPSGFSNVYLIGRDKADGAASILVNGPQFGWFNPSYVYSIGLHGAGIDVVGNTPFGYPMIMFGHNETISWGSTWGASDIVDIYVETVNPDNPGQYLHDGQYLDFETRLERIDVKGGEPVSLEILRSVHGPIIQQDADGIVVYAKKRAWDGRELENLLAWLHATWAGNWDEWKAQAEKASINVNMYFADVDGNVGYFHGGWFPERAPGHDNRLPVTGDGSMEWQGRQSVDSANPHVLNPSTGYLANWNNKPGHGVMNPDFFFYSWSSADRVDYLNRVLAEEATFTPDEAWAVLDSSSYTDVFAPYFLPVIDAALSESEDPALQRANEILASWDLQSRDDNGDGYYDGEATAIFRHFVWALTDSVLTDDLGDVAPFFVVRGYPTADAPSGAGTNLPSGIKAIVESMAGNTAYDLFNGVPVAAVVQSAMVKALAEAEAGLKVAPRPYSARNFLGIPQAGENEALMTPVEQNRGTENNMIVLRPGAIEGWEVTPPGQSGFISPDGTRSDHYDDQLEMYTSFGRKRTWFYPDDVEANKMSEVSLTY